MIGKQILALSTIASVMVLAWNPLDKPPGAVLRSHGGLLLVDSAGLGAGLIASSDKNEPSCSDDNVLPTQNAREALITILRRQSTGTVVPPSAAPSTPPPTISDIPSPTPSMLPSTISDVPSPTPSMLPSTIPVSTSSSSSLTPSPSSTSRFSSITSFNRTTVTPVPTNSTSSISLSSDATLSATATTRGATTSLPAEFSTGTETVGSSSPVSTPVPTSNVVPTNITVTPDSPNITYSGNWTAVPPVCNTTTNAMQCTGADMFFSYTFKGTAIFLHLGTGKDGGLYSVDLDGDKQQLDSYSPDDGGCKLGFTKDGLENKEHSMTVKTLGPSPQAPIGSEGGLDVESIIVTTPQPLSSSCSSVFPGNVLAIVCALVIWFIM